jgi:hypothetical protein
MQARSLIARAGHLLSTILLDERKRLAARLLGGRGTGAVRGFLHSPQVPPRNPGGRAFRRVQGAVLGAPSCGSRDAEVRSSTNDHRGMLKSFAMDLRKT